MNMIDTARSLTNEASNLWKLMDALLEVEEFLPKNEVGKRYIVQSLSRQADHAAAHLTRIAQHLDPSLKDGDE